MSRSEVMVGVVLAAAFAYPVAMRILAVRTQATRIKLLRLGEDLLASPSLTVAQKAAVQRYMDDCFSAKKMAIIAAFLPIYIVRCLYFGRRREPVSADSIPTAVADRFKKIQNYHLRSIAAANPFCTVIVVVEMVVLWLPLRLTGLIDGGSPNGHGKTHGQMRADARRLAAHLDSHLLAH